MDRRNMLGAVTAGGMAATIAATTVTPALAQDAGASSIDRIKAAGVLKTGVIVGQEPYFHKDLVSNHRHEEGLPQGHLGGTERSGRQDRGGHRLGA